MSLSRCSYVRIGCQAMHFLWCLTNTGMCLLLGQQVLHCHSLLTGETQGLHNGGRSQWMHCCPAPLLCSSLQHQPVLSSSLLLLRLMHEQAGQVLVGQFGVPNDINVASRASHSPSMLTGLGYCPTGTRLLLKGESWLPA